jgi:Lipid A 3-O-deacylase (PagL)
LLPHLFYESVLALHRIERRMARIVGLNRLAILALGCFLAPQLAHSQEPEVATAMAAPPISALPDAPDAPLTSNATLESDSVAVLNAPAGLNPPAEIDSGETNKTRQKKPVESELAVSGMISYGDHKMFGAALRCNLWTAGVEYDRHIWHYFLKARVDYVVELLPFVLLSEPAVADVWGNPVSPNNKFVHGMGLSPFGFRYMWRSNMKVKPYLIGKAGGIFFPIKVLSPNASYASFAFQGDFGLQIRMTDRVELRVDPVEYFHFSNAYIVKSNPGLDELSAKVGLSYHLGKSSNR